MTAVWIVAGLAVWTVLAVAVGVLIGRGIRAADSPTAHLERRQRPYRNRSGHPMKGGQVLMGPQQPRPQVQQRIPGPPPQRGGGYPATGPVITEMPRAPRGPAPGGRRPPGGPR